jgi:carbon-monoxide dehydrogenase medium subunit
MDIAVVGAGVNLTLDAAGVVTDARVALGAVAPTVLVVEAPPALIGTRSTRQRWPAGRRRPRRLPPISDKRGTIDFAPRSPACSPGARRSSPTPGGAR